MEESLWKISPTTTGKWISSAHEAGNLNSMGAVLGNDAAIKAYRDGLPFPGGTMLSLEPGNRAALQAAENSALYQDTTLVAPLID
jgi:hypothetical protein